MTSQPHSSWAWVALGSNIGHRHQALENLRELLRTPTIEILQASSEIFTRPVGVTEQPYFLNQVVLLQSAKPISALNWLAHCQQAEAKAGKKPTYRWGPRRADADILLLGQHGEIKVNHLNLIIPHPELSHRTFWGRLLAEPPMAAFTQVSHFGIDLRQ